MKPQAFEAFQKGLNLKSGHPRILEELERYDRRGERVFSSLPREHILNRLLGRLRNRLRHLFDRAAAQQT